MEYSEKVQHLYSLNKSGVHDVGKYYISKTISPFTLKIYRLGLYMGKMWIFICGLTLEYC